MAKPQTRPASKKDVINLTDDDFKAKTYKTAPGGTYFIKISKQKSKVKPGSQGNIANLHITISRGKHKGITLYESLAPHVGWKIAQLLHALGVKKLTLTLQELIKLVGDKELRAVLKEEKYQGKKNNKVVQFLPLEAAADEESDEDEDLDDDDSDEDDDDDDSDDDADDDDSDDDDSDDDDDDDDEEDDDSDEEADDDAEDDDEDEDEDDDEAEEEDADDEDEDEDEDDDEEDAPPVKPVNRRAAARAARKAAPEAPASAAPAKKAAAKKAAPPAPAKATKAKKK